MVSGIMIKIEVVNDHLNYCPIRALRPIRPYVAEVTKDGLKFLSGQRGQIEMVQDGC